MGDRPGPTTSVQARAVSGSEVRAKSDVVVSEEPLEIRLSVDGREHPIAITMRTPGNDFELAVGFLTTEGVLDGPADLAAVRYCVEPPAEQAFNIVTVELRPGARVDLQRLSRNVYTTSSCGVCGKTSLEAIATHHHPPVPSGPMVDAAVLAGMPDVLLAKQRVFERTGGLHAAGLFDAHGTALIVREDVGRHNAVDKLVGALVLEQRFPASPSVLVVSGRASFEILQKAVMAGIGFVAAVGAPSSLAVRAAEDFGMTLAGFVRDGSFNIYAGAERVVL